MALRRLYKQYNIISLYNHNILNVCNNNIIFRSKQHFATKGIPKDIAAHIEQLKSIASQSNKEYLLPEANNINKSKSKSKKTLSRTKNKYIDKYSFNYNQTKSEQHKIKEKQKLTKILNAMQSDKMPISQGRVIDTPSYFELSTDSESKDNSPNINEAASKLPSDLTDILSKFTENSHPSSYSAPSIPIPSIKVDEKFDYNEYIKTHRNDEGINLSRISIEREHSNIMETSIDEKDEDERMEKEAMEISLKKHNDEINALKIDLMGDENVNNLREKIDIKRRELLNGEREHFYIKDGKSTFNDIGVSDILSSRLYLLGYKCPSIIQSLFIKQYHSLCNKRNTLIMGAETGSGKTLGYVIPIIDDIIEEYINMDIIQFTESTDSQKLENMLISRDKLPYLKYPKCVIIEPTPELCGQVRGVIQSIGRIFGLRVESWSEDHIPPPMTFLYDYLYSHYDDDGVHNKIQSSPEILVVTPSVLKHVFNPRFVLRLNYLVFDEADIMLTHKAGKGKWSDIEQILKSLQKYQKDKLLSGFHSDLYEFRPCLYIFTAATLANKRVQIFLGNHGKRSKKQKKTNLPDSLMKLFAKSIWITSPLQHRYSPNLTQKWLFIRDNQEQQELFLRALHRHPAQKNRYKKQGQSFPPLQQTIVFCNSSQSVDDAVKFLKFHRIPCKGIHERIGYNERENILHKFYFEKKISILIATDILCRGYDFGTNIECVIQLDFAKTPDIHYNRVGRTARAGRKGLAINLYMNHNTDLVKQLINIYNNNERIDKLFKVKNRNILTKRQKQKLKKMGIEPPLSVKEQSEKLGIKPKKKNREFRFFDIQKRIINGNKNKNKNKPMMKKKKKDDDNNKKIINDKFINNVHWKGDDNHNDGDNSFGTFDFDQFLLDTKKIINN